MDKKYYPTVGLEVHAELKTNAKMFCSCKNDPDEKTPNVNICPVCMAHPGALPVPNKKAIENVIKVGLAVGGKIADFTEFDRKNYFYPDIPKGYQISQYKFPIVSGGHLASFNITRVHLEEDTAKNFHEGDHSLVDFNRAGVPLMELVTEPHTFESAKECARAASDFAKELQLVLWYLGVSEANMEKGEMRVEANISLSPTKDKFGTKVEVKNLNSFKSVYQAILFELARMEELHVNGKDVEIVQETRGWDEGKQKTFSQRKKESSEDYRYFPDPDLPKMKLHEAFDLKKMKEELPELPEEKRKRLKKEYDASEEVIEICIYNPKFSDWYEKGVKENKLNKDEVKKFSNFAVNDLANTWNKIPVSSAIGITQLFASAAISSAVAKQMFADIAEAKISSDIDVKKYAEQHGLIQKSDVSEIKVIAIKVVEANPKAVADYKAGKENAIMSLVGQVMKETKGTANPQVARSSILSILEDK